MGDLGSIDCRLFSACSSKSNASRAGTSLRAPRLCLQQEEPSTAPSSRAHRQEQGPTGRSRDPQPVSNTNSRCWGVPSGYNWSLFQVDSGLGFDASQFKHPCPAPRIHPRQHSSVAVQTHPWLCPQPLGNLPPTALLLLTQAAHQEKGSETHDRLGDVQRWSSAQGCRRFPPLCSQAKSPLCNYLMIHLPPRDVPSNQLLSYFLIKSFGSLSL